MKLSKDELALVLAEAGLEIYDAFIGGTLDIEGYIRADHIADDSKKVEEWTKFDPNDPKTFPTELGDYLVRLLCGETEIENWCGENFGFSFADECYISHWRPLPEPPQETEGK